LWDQYITVSLICKQKSERIFAAVSCSFDEQMTSLDHIAQMLLQEKVDINRGLVGVELELLIRKDIDRSRSFTDMLFDLEFSFDRDSSVRKNIWSRDIYYNDFETSSNEPTSWEHLRPRLVKLVSWLKREDLMYVTKDAQATKKVFGGQGDPNFRPIKLSRGKSPNNPTAGMHLHFDVNSWFDNTEHTKRFVEAFNQYGPSFKDMVPASRYSHQHFFGNEYASFRKQDFLHKSRGLSLSQYDPGEALAKSSGGKYHALNMKSAMERGDIEFRFVNSTLNIGTIEGWLYTFAELIEYTRHQTPENWGQYLSKEAPEQQKFIQQRRAKMAKSSTDPMAKLKGGTIEEPVGPQKDKRAILRQVRSVVPKKLPPDTGQYSHYSKIPWNAGQS
jgi:hypothetical protein